MKIKIICATCGSDDVRRDATAAWDVDAQEWSLAGVQDQGYCEACDREARLEDVPLDPWRLVPLDVRHTDGTGYTTLAGRLVDGLDDDTDRHLIAEVRQLAESTLSRPLVRPEMTISRAVC